MKKYKNKYRIPSARHPAWDYSNNGAYFITICTKNREYFFGGIRNGIMGLNEIGAIVYDEWMKTPSIRPDMNIQLGEFIVMPNHLHGIIIIGENQYNRTDAMHRVSNTFGPQRKNLASIIRGFKSAITIHARHINTQFAWQPRFHDHIIRDHGAFLRIQNYIANNPSNWKNDKFQ